MSSASDRGPQRVTRVLAAGALEVFAGYLRSIIYKRAAWALEVFTVSLAVTERTAGEPTKRRSS
ncbi:hypothetical protein EXE53_05530 [Halorubrum sp. SD626R]|nr:hypothetical protein EXE53_05530 [Halorubrum sp. SD626R]